MLPVFKVPPLTATVVFALAVNEVVGTAVPRLAVPALTVMVSVPAASVTGPVVFKMPPSTVTAEVLALQVTVLPTTVPVVCVPALTLNNPVMVALPAWPVTVALALFSQKPPVAGMVYAAAAKTGLLMVTEPFNLNVPLVMVSAPVAGNEKVLEGLKSKIFALLAPLLSVIKLNVVTAVAEVVKVLFAAPVKVILILLFADASALKVPLFIKLPPIDKTCASVADAPLCNTPPASMVTSFATVIVLAVAMG